MIIALDVGTSSTRATVYDSDRALAAVQFHQETYPPRVTRDGGVEHDAERLLHAVAACLDAVQPHPREGDVAAVAVTTFWHGLCGFDASGQPITPVYTWADTRSTEDARLLATALDERALHARTGCHLHPSYWPAKLRWLARERPQAFERVARWGSVGELLELAFFGDTSTSISMASATGLLDQDTVAWDAEALAAAGIEERQLFPLSDLTPVRRELRRPWASRWRGLRTAAWLPAVGDGAASNVGSDCTDPTRVAINVGTSAALRVMTEAPPVPPAGLWRYRLDRRRSLVGGATSEGGNVFAWCRDVLRLPSDLDVEAALAAVEADGHGLTVLPFLAGERSPGWRGDRRATVHGLFLETTAVDILKAVLEAVAFRLALVYDLLHPCATPDHTIVASGAALTHSPVWAQIIADVLGRPLVLSPREEATSRGAALLALEALGLAGRAAAAPGPPGRIVAPDPARHARYRDALARQRRLDQRI